ncbi:MAG: VTC domain-containing protein [Bacteroidetes bacterium]|jgi:SPX domain protein involved in polyphosphate accumulation|nr:VTC domain-containing protein [Bacteroidota bacterium]
MDQTHQKQRFELKYHITEDKARQIRFFVQNYLSTDRHSRKRSSSGYDVHSLYFDSPFLKTYQDTINGNRNRYKLRLRYYSDDSPVFMEIKRRYDWVIRKKRTQIKRDSVPQLVRGQMPGVDCLVQKTPEDTETLNRFVRHQQMLSAAPKIHVFYKREAYQLEESNDARVTIDRNVMATDYIKSPLPTEIPGSLEVFPGEAILEIKFTNRFPIWLQELTERFHLRRESASKYVDAVKALKYTHRKKGNLQTIVT